MTVAITDPRHAAFLRVICEAPWDDMPRLIYADWLTENGHEERAEFIRVQVEIAALDPYHLSCTGKKCPGCAALRRRERGLAELPPLDWPGAATD